jgi:cysteine desulfurase/selenocysteine lyase
MKNVQSDFPLLQQTIDGHSVRYCDNASTTQKPTAVLHALNQFYTTYNSNIHRGIYLYGEMATEAYEHSRTTIAHFLHAHSAANIIFTRGTTEGINAVATAWARSVLRPGDEIVITALEHHTNLLPWQQLIKTNGIVLKVIPVHSNGSLDMTMAEQLITKRTKLVATTHISNAIGTHVDIKILQKYARTVGARILIDAAQSATHMVVNIQDMDPDFLVFSGHKMCGPTGIGILYIKQDLCEQMDPYQFGGGMVFSAGDANTQWLPAPHKFEAGTPPIAQAIGLAAAVEYLQQQCTQQQLQQHTASLCSRLIKGLSAISAIRILGDVEQLSARGHLVSFVHQKFHAHDIAAYLGTKGICVRAGHHCAQPLAHVLQYHASVRVSFYLYNTLEDVDAILTHLAYLE